MVTLAIYNHPIETLGTFRKYFHNVKEIYAEELKGNEDFEELIIMGGPMGVYERDKYGFLETEMQLIRKAYYQNKKVLGVCLGSQLIAEALGGKVIKGPYGVELGVQKVKIIGELSNFLKTDELLVFQWHGDTFSLPIDAVLLAYNRNYFQAFRVKRILGLQFHLEVDSDMIKEWVKNYGGDNSIVDDVKRNEKELEHNVEKIISYYRSL